MHTEVRYTMLHPYAGGRPEDFWQAESVVNNLAHSLREPEEWEITTHYADGTQDTLDGREWRKRYDDRQKARQAPMPPFYSEAPQKALVAALDRYNERYDNTLYLAACHSLRLIEDQPEYIQQAVRIQDVALYLCGAENLPCMTPTRITREMVIFWMDFASDRMVEDSSEDLPF